MLAPARLLLAVLLAILLIGTCTLMYFFGLGAGVMADDSCSGKNTDQVSLWLTLVWPATLLISALTPPLRLALKARWLWVLVGAGVGALISLGVVIPWFPLLASIDQ